MIARFRIHDFDYDYEYLIEVVVEWSRIMHSSASCLSTDVVCIRAKNKNWTAGNAAELICLLLLSFI